MGTQLSRELTQSIGRDNQVFSTYACGVVQLPMTTRRRFSEGRRGLYTLEGTRLVGLSGRMLVVSNRF